MGEIRIVGPGASFTKKDRTISLKMPVRSFLRSAYVVSQKHRKMFVQPNKCVSQTASYFLICTNTGPCLTTCMITCRLILGV